MKSIHVHPLRVVYWLIGYDLHQCGAAQQRYRPLDVFSFVTYQSANAADNSISKRFTGKMGDEFFSSSLLKTGSTRNSAPVQLVQQRLNI